MSDHSINTEDLSGLCKQEQELLTYYRALTTFNQRRVFTIARNAYDDIQRAIRFRENNYQANKG